METVSVPYNLFVFSLFQACSKYFCNVRRQRSLAENVFVVIITAAARVGARELDERVSTRLFGTCMLYTHWRHLTGGRSSAHRSAPRQSLVRWRGCVHDMHVLNSHVDTRSSILRAPVQVAAVGHESIFCEDCIVT